jgi:DNA repair exonuclease SbcCD ATPase subunit
MDIQSIKNGLLSILDKFRRIHGLTRSLREDFEQETIDTVVAERGALIDAIISERKSLSVQDADWERKAQRTQILADLMKEIEQTVLAIKSMDDKLAALMTRQLEKIKAELKGLYHHSRATYAYAAQAQSAPQQVS